MQRNEVASRLGSTIKRPAARMPPSSPERPRTVAEIWTERPGGRAGDAGAAMLGFRG